MFTGIIEELGAVTAVELVDEAARLTLHAPLATSDAALGDSIAVNGVCLTVVHVAGPQFTADVMRETLDRSNLGEASPGDMVNLERAATLQSRLGGHLVQGHVDATGVVSARTPTPQWHVLRITLPVSVRRYVVEKGSIALDGVSLTVSALGEDWCEVSLIPTTLRATTWGTKPLGTRVNVEVDVLAKYLERLAQPGMEMLRTATQTANGDSDD